MSNHGIDISVGQGDMETLAKGETAMYVAVVID